jgi:hypothetical protein
VYLFDLSERTRAPPPEKGPAPTAGGFLTQADYNAAVAAAQASNIP